MTEENSNQPQTQNEENENESKSKSKPKPKARGRPKGNYGKYRKKEKKPEKKPKEFRLAGKTLFLTYPKCDLNLRDMYQAMYDRLNAYCILDFLIVAEMHEDGSPHRHVLIKLMKRIDRKDPRFLDIAYDRHQLQPVVDENTKEHVVDPVTNEPQFYTETERVVAHGSYSIAKSETASLEYLTKDIFTPQQAYENMLISQNYSKKLGALYQHISLSERLIFLAENGNIGQATELLKQESPELYLRSGTQIETRLKELYFQSFGMKRKFDMEDFVIPPALQEAIDNFKACSEVKEAKTFVLKGDPGSGKTCFMVTLLEAMGKNVCVVNHREGLATFKADKHTAVLFDDPDFRTESREQLIHILDTLYSCIKIRFVNAILPDNTLRAITTNIDLADVNYHFTSDAVQRRVVFHELPPGTKLFDKNAETTDPEKLKTREVLNKLEEYQKRNPPTRRKP